MANEYLGEPKERRNFDVRLYEEPSRVETDWGASFVYRFEDDDGNHLVWFASKEQPLDSGKQYQIRGTVKRHAPFKGVKQTHLMRVTVLSVRDLDSEPPGKAFDDLCREHGIPLREDYDSEMKYRKARRKAGLP